MALLLIDIGNSRLKWALHDRQRLGECRTLDYRDADLIGRLAREWQGLPAPQRAVAAGVGPAWVARAVRTWVGEHWNLHVTFVTSPAQGLGVVNGYLEPARLGADRWAALVAARARTRQACCVVDCGTAITFDLLDADGVHRGGVILPGLDLLGRALAAGTAGVRAPERTPSGNLPLLGRDTETGVAAGALNAAAGFIDRMRRQSGGVLDVPPVGILTGGAAPAVRPLLADDWEHVPDLVLEGLGRMALDAGEGV